MTLEQGRGKGPPNENRAPTLGDPAEIGDTTTTIADSIDTGRRPRRGRGAELLEQLRRRYEAARRLPPLPCGRRDPVRPAELVQRGGRP